MLSIALEEWFQFWLKDIQKLGRARTSSSFSEIDEDGSGPVVIELEGI